VTELYHGTGLQEAHFLDNIQQQKTDLVDSIFTVFGQAAQVDEAEVGVGVAFLSRDSHLGRRWVIVELDPEGMKQLGSLVFVQGACLCLSLVKGEEVLVETPWIEGIPGIEFSDHAQVDKPVVL